MPRAKAAPKPADDSDDAPLKRLGSGRWQTRDERFTIEPQSGTWAVVDAEQTDDFGMPLVRGPYPSLTDAKAAISTARTSAPAASPLTERIEQRKSRPGAGTETAEDAPRTPKADRPDSAKDTQIEQAPEAPQTKKAARASSAKPDRKEEPVEPGWLTDLAPAERGRARRLIARLEEQDVADATAVVRRDVLGDVPAVATIAVRRRLDALGPDAAPADVAALLADGRDEGLDVRWRLVDGAGRPIVLEKRPGRR
ncbi:MAG: hypothetical protein H0U52_03015 [Chloroflexi bacterium]|nr:hypothetical protein [Chloroflexota bacterium]